MNNQIHLIARLKQQPRQGGGGDNAFTILTDQAKELYKQFAIGGQDIVRVSGFNMLSDAVTTAYENVNILEKRNRKLSESFGVTTMRAAQLSEQFDKVGIKLGVNTDKLKTYAGELKKLFPGQAAYLANAGKFGKTILKQAELLRNKLGLSSEITEGFIRNQALLSTEGSKTFDTLNQEIAEYSYGLRGTYEGAFADITEGIGNLDAETAAVFGREGIGNLSKAVLGAKKLGVELGKVLATGTGFLDVEQAIGNEIELQILGAKDLNVAAIQEARLKGDGAALTQEITKYLEANGEAMKGNSFLLTKSAEALGFSNSELLEMYANLKQNNKLELETASGKAAREKEIEATIAEENKQRMQGNSLLKDADKIKEMTRTEEEQFLANKLSLMEQQNDKSQQAYAQSILDAKDSKGDSISQAEQVMKLAAGLSTSMDGALKASTNLVAALDSSTLVEALIGAGGLIGTLTEFLTKLKTGFAATEGPGETVNLDKSVKAGDVFIPATGGNVISGAFGSFELNPKDDILAMPNARDAISNQGSTTSNITTQGGTDTAALIAALQGMSFHVTNTFDGDKIQSQLTIRQGQRLNA